MGINEGQNFAGIFDRELDHLAREIELYEDEAELWVTRGEQKNSPGTLALHLCGNLMHYIGDGLGNTGYVRDRDAEFVDRVSRAELLERVAACRDAVVPVLEALPDQAFDAVYPGEPPTRMSGIRTRPFLLHLTWHIGWHRGQIYYHRTGKGV